MNTSHWQFRQQPFLHSFTSNEFMCCLKILKQTQIQIVFLGRIAIISWHDQTTRNALKLRILLLESRCYELSSVTRNWPYSQTGHKRLWLTWWWHDGWTARLTLVIACRPSLASWTTLGKWQGQNTQLKRLTTRAFIPTLPSCSERKGCNFLWTCCCWGKLVFLKMRSFKVLFLRLIVWWTYCIFCITGHTGVWQSLCLATVLQALNFCVCPHHVCTLQFHFLLHSAGIIAPRKQTRERQFHRVTSVNLSLFFFSGLLSLWLILWTYSSGLE